MNAKIEAILAASGRIETAIGRPVKLSPSMVFGEWVKIELPDVPNKYLNLSLAHCTVEQAIQKLCDWRP